MVRWDCVIHSHYNFVGNLPIEVDDNIGGSIEPPPPVLNHYLTTTIFTKQVRPVSESNYQ